MTDPFLRKKGKHVNKEDGIMEELSSVLGMYDFNAISYPNHFYFIYNTISTGVICTNLYKW